MADVNAEPTGTVVKTEPVQTDKTENAIPYARFKEVNEELKTLKAEREARQAADKQASDDKLLKKGEYEKLIEQQKAELEIEKKRSKELEDKANAYEQSQTKLRADAISQLPDDLKEYAKEFSVSNLLSFVDKYKTGKISPFSGKGAATAIVAGNEYAMKPGESVDQYHHRLRTMPKKAK